MFGTRTLPHLVADPRAIQGTPWEMVVDTPRFLPALLSDWRPEESIEIRRSLIVDGRFVAASSGVGDQAEVVAFTSWRGGHTYLRGVSDRVPVDLNWGRQRIDINIIIPSAEVAGSIHLQTGLVLMRQGRKADPLAAYQPGSVLWYDPHEDPAVVQLHAGTARFPMTTVDFLEHGLSDQHACWYLDWQSEDLMAPAMHSLRLYINTGNHRFYRAVSTAEPDGEALLIRATLRQGIARELVWGALRVADQLLERDYGPETTGGMLLDLIETRMNPLDLTDLVQLQQHDPGKLEMVLQSRFNLMGGE